MSRESSSGEESEELLILMKEIMSLEKERKDLLDSLIPSLSGWKATTPHWISGEEQKNSSKAESAAHDDEKQLLITSYLLDSILEDMEGLGHRMLSSMASIPNTSYSLFKANELASTTSRLMRITEQFYNKSKEQEKRKEEDEDEEISNGFLSICSNYLQCPDNYKNQLALLVFFKHRLTLTVTKEKDQKDHKENKYEEDEEEEKHRKEKEKDPSTIEFLKMVTNFYHQIFSDHHSCWERIWGSERLMGRCGAFEDTTTVSSMQFTHCTPGTIPSHAAVTGSTLQIYSIEIKELNGNLNWPLKVYGVVAARDTVDRNRNILFSRTKRNYQLITKKDPFLYLTGPSRAILAVDPVDFEVNLKINEGAESRERALIILHKRYDATQSTSLFLHSPDCTAELSIERLATPLQATIVGVRVVEGGCPFKHGCRVVCSSSAAAEVTPREVVLLDYHGKGMRVGWDGYLHLSRNVVSVELQGTLKVVIQAYSKSGDCQAQVGHVDFPAQQCQTRKSECFVGNSKLEIVVAWSLLVKEKQDLLVDCRAIERSTALV